MKAVIMAGGKGTRLRPLTCHLPKPMAPLLDRPCMEYIIELLKRHGITEIAVTVQYLPQMIKNYFGDGLEFGVRLHYFDETTPLGTAGSVKNAEAFLDDTFVVISGDALTDFDLHQAIAFHRDRQALGTLVLTRVEVPIEYGVVMTAEDGRIVRFLEKPSWSEVFSDTVNTGIYVLEPAVLGFFHKNQEFDFSKNLFPMLMEQNQPLYGYIAEGYWSDIGNLAQYRQAQFDMLTGVVDIDLPGIEHAPGVRIGGLVHIHPESTVVGPAYLGDGTVVHPSAHIGPFSVIGRFNRIESGAAVERSVLWHRNHIGRCASLEGATICSGIIIGDSVKAEQNVVVGDNSEIRTHAVVKHGVKIWPHKTVGEGRILGSSLIWSDIPTSGLFDQHGVSGIPNRDLTPEFTVQVAAAFGSWRGRGTIISVSCDGHPNSHMLKHSVVAGLISVGVKVKDLESMVVPVARYECRSSDSHGAIHIRKSGEHPSNRFTLQFFGGNGLPIDKGAERKIENLFFQEDFARPDCAEFGLLRASDNVTHAYIDQVLSSVDVDSVQSRQFRVVLTGQSLRAVTVIQEVLDRLGCQCMLMFNEQSDLGSMVLGTQADLGISIGPSGEAIQLVADHGRLLSDMEVLRLQALLNVESESHIAVPIHVPSVIEDGYCTVACLLGFLARQSKRLSAVVEQLPTFHSANVLAEEYKAKIGVILGG